MALDETVAISLVLSILGNIINGAGYLQQKRAHNRIHAADKKISFTSDSGWRWGFGIYAFGSVLHGAGLALGPQSLLTPMESLTLATNAVFAPSVLGEVMRTRDKFATVLIIIGAVMSVIFGPHGTAQYTVEELFELWGGTEFLMFAALLSSLAATDYFFVRLTEQKNRDRGLKLTGNLSQPTAKFLALSYTLLAGFFGMFTNLLTKSTGEVVQSSITQENQFVNPLTYVLIFMFICCNITLEFWKQKALSTFDALYVVPVFQVSLVILAIIAGGVFFKEFSSMSLTNGALFATAVAIICIGILILSSSEAEERWKHIKKIKDVLTHVSVVNAFRSASVEDKTKPLIKERQASDSKDVTTTIPEDAELESEPDTEEKDDTLSLAAPDASAAPRSGSSAHRRHGSAMPFRAESERVQTNEMNVPVDVNSLQTQSYNSVLGSMFSMLAARRVAKNVKGRSRELVRQRSRAESAAADLERPNLKKSVSEAMSSMRKRKSGSALASRPPTGRASSAAASIGRDPSADDAASVNSDEAAEAAVERLTDVTLAATLREGADGLMVASINDEVANAGQLEYGDIVTSLDGNPAHSTQTLEDVLEGKYAGDTIAFVVKRGDAEQTVQVTVGSGIGLTRDEIATLRATAQLPA